MFISKTLKVCVGLSVFGVLLLTGTLVFIFYGKEALLSNIIKNSVVLREGSVVWDRFVTIPFPFYFKGYLFHLENADEVLNFNTKPKLKETGPFIFDQFRNKIVYDEESSDNIIAFREKQFYVYNETLSNGLSLDEIVTVINPVFFGITSALESINISLPIDLEVGLKSMFDEPYVFFTASAKSLLFDGVKICDPEKTDSIGKVLCLLLMIIQPTNIDFKEDLSMTFSFLSYRNDTDNGFFRFDRGVNDIENLGSIVQWNNVTYTDYWNGENSPCNKVSDAKTTVFPAFLNKDMDFEVFSPDVCKAVNIIYNGTNTYDDIEGYRFKTYQNSLTSSDDDCYCTEAKDFNGNETCFSEGLLNLYTCLAAPIILSFPHLLWVDESLRNTVDGLNPSEDIHLTYVDIDPYLGIPLQATQKVQFNLVLRPYNFGNGNPIILTQNLSRALTPLIWIDEGVSLPPDVTGELKDELYDNLVLLGILQWCLLAISIAVVLVPSLYFLAFKIWFEKPEILRELTASNTANNMIKNNKIQDEIDNKNK